MTYMLTAEFEDGLFEALRHAFTAILVRDAADSDKFKSRVERFKVHGLLSYRMESMFKPKEINFDPARVEDSRYRRKLIRELKAPRPSKWVYRNIQIDRSKLADEGYLNDIAKLLAYGWSKALMPIDSPLSALLLLKQDADFVSLVLDKFGPHQISSEVVAHYRLRTFIEDAVDNNETLKASLAEIRKVGAEARAKFSEEMAVVNKEILRDFNARMDSILAETKASCDSALTHTSGELADVADHSRKVLEESGYPNRDPEKEWREQLRKADEKRKAESPKLSWTAKALITLGGLGVATLLGFYLEVGPERVTPFAALASWFN